MKLNKKGIAYLVWVVLIIATVITLAFINWKLALLVWVIDEIIEVSIVCACFGKEALFTGSWMLKEEPIVIEEVDW